MHARIQLKRKLFSQIMLIAHLVSLPERILSYTEQVHRVLHEPEMRKPELKRITAAFRQLTPA